MRLTIAATPTPNRPITPTSSPVPIIARSTGPLVSVGSGYPGSMKPLERCNGRATRNAGYVAAIATSVVPSHAHHALASTTLPRCGIAANVVPTMPEPYSPPIVTTPTTAATIIPVSTPPRASATMSLSPNAPGGSVVLPPATNAEKPIISRNSTAYAPRVPRLAQVLLSSADSTPLMFRLGRW